MKAIALITVAGLVAGCGWQAGPCGRDGIDGARMRLLAADAAFARAAFERGPAAAFAEVLADHSVFLAGNYATLYGIDDIVTFFSGSEGVRMSWTPADGEVARSCELGYTFGAWRAGGEDVDGNPLDLRGKYLGVWRHAPDTGWRLAVYMHNSDPPDAVL